jgi:preprotein translocase SecE subunit
MSNKPPSGTPAPSSIPLPKSKRGFRQYWVDVGREMRKVTWPPHSETNRLTGVVLAVCALLLLILYGFHLVFQTLVNLVTGAQS